MCPFPYWAGRTQLYDVLSDSPREGESPHVCTPCSPLSQCCPGHTRPLDRKLPEEVSLCVLQFTPLFPAAGPQEHQVSQEGGRWAPRCRPHSKKRTRQWRPSPAALSQQDRCIRPPAPQPHSGRLPCRGRERAATRLQGPDEPPALHAKASELPWPSSLRLSHIPGSA